MQVSMTVVLTRSEMSAIKDLQTKINTLVGVKSEFEELDITIKAKSNLSSVLYALRVSDKLEMRVNLEVNPTVMQRQLKAYAKLLDIVLPIADAMKTALPSLKEVSNDLEELQDELNSDLEIEITKE